MQVRKFEATTMRDAIAAVKRELGTNKMNSQGSHQDFNGLKDTDD